MTATLASSTRVNNAVYETLGERWYGAEDDPIGAGEVR